MNLENIKAAIRDVQSAKLKLLAEVKGTFPIGSDVSWDKHGHRQYGVVLDHGHAGRLRVENTFTGAKYWIGMYDVVGYVETKAA